MLSLVTKQSGTISLIKHDTPNLFLVIFDHTFQAIPRWSCGESSRLEKKNDGLISAVVNLSSFGGA